MSQRSRLQRAWTRYFWRAKSSGLKHYGDLTPNDAATAYSRRTRNATPRQLFKGLDKKFNKRHTSEMVYVSKG